MRIIYPDIYWNNRVFTNLASGRVIKLYEDQLRCEFGENILEFIM